MANGTGLVGNTSSGQGAVAFQRPGYPNHYFLITNQCGVALNDPNGNLYYHQIDMAQNGGLGAVTTKNVLLGAANTASEALAAVPNHDGSKAWVLTATNGANRILAYEFDRNGPTGVVVTTTLSSNNGLWFGTLRFSADMSKVVQLSNNNGETTWGPTQIRLLNFNAQTGQLTENWTMTIPSTTLGSAYGADFSPNGNYIYVSSIGSGGLFQYDLASNTGAGVLASGVRLATSGSIGNIRRAPNGKMYVANLNQNTISVINSPNTGGVGADFVLNGLSLAAGQESEWGLPEMVQGCTVALVDTDTDGTPDLDDLDDDNDGILDTVEAPSCYFTASEANAIASISTGLTISTGTTPLLFNGVLTTATPNFAFTAGQALANANLFTVSYPTPVNLTSLTIVNATSLGASATARLQGSLNGTTWVDLTSAAVSLSTAANKVFTVNQNAGEYPYYRVLGVATATSLANPIFEITSILNASYDPSAHPKGTCTVDTDNDGIIDSLDLDSDGDGCSDALEGGASFTTGALVTSTLAGGNSGAGYTGTSTSPVIQNLGNTVGSTVTTLGVPIVAGTGQSIGLSQSGSINACIDSDGDGVANVDDSDDDNDGILDLVECPTPSQTIRGGGNGISSVTAVNYPASTYSYAGGTLAGLADGTAADSYFNIPPAIADAGTHIIDINLTQPTALSNFYLANDWGVTGDELKDFQLEFLNASGNSIAVLNYRATATSGWQVFNFPAPFTGVKTVRFSLINWWGHANANSQIGDLGFGVPCDTDGDGIYNQLDLDADGDGCPDAIEGGASFTTANSTGTGALSGSVSVTGVPTIAGSGQTIGTSQNASAQDANCPPPPDTDVDGVPDATDLDDDNDGIPDTVEAANALNGGDTDGDGIPDTLDLDSDGDGILDFVEARNLTPAQIATLDANGDGRLDGAVGTDGIPDSVQTTPNAGTVNYTPLDTDGDGNPDFQDLDSDNDGINDVVEASPTGVNNDTNGDGKADGTVNTNGVASMPNTTALGLGTPDTDGDGKPDFRDLDSDNDGINDVVEAGLSDPDNNGIAGTGANPTDTDNDGIPDAVDGAPAVFGDASDPAPLNSDNDPIPNYRDLDSDNDTIADVIEGGNGPADTNGDGTISPTESGDTDGDGIPNAVDNAPSSFGDAGNAALPEGADTDTIPDYIDPDSDGDGLNDICELTSNCALDGNGDGQVDNPTDPDGDGIPNNGGIDSIPGGFGGATVPTPPTDTDGDGIANVSDLDDDNDGIPDTVEAANALNGGDTDGDGIPDTLDLDSDGDGILDFVEARNLTPAQIATLDANGDGRLDGAVGTDGIPDSVQTTPNAGSVNYTPLDTDADGNPDFQDLDSDNDGISDVVEASPSGVNNDTNGDGKADGTVDANGVASMPNTTALGLGAPDTDGDGKPDFRDLDSDNDGINDVVEAGLSDPDNNGIAGTGANPTDTDNDGIPDVVDGTPTAFGDASDPAPLNSDNDPIPNYRDLDSDNDTIADVIEGGNGPADTNGDGTISPTESGDIDGDGIPNAVDNAPSSFGDAGNAALPEGTDTDTIPDYIDPDSDGDGINDICELTSNCALDGNGDGQVDNPTDPDGDGIPNNNGNDTVPGGFGGATVPVVIPPFQQWQNQTPDSGTGPANNQDFDRLTDLQEYAFASDPGTGVPVVLSNGAPVNGTVVAGDTGLQVAKANGAYDVSYRRPLGGRSDVTYTLQQSSDLSTWTDVTATPSITTNLNGTETVKWTALGTAGQTRFVRMKLVLASPATTQYSWVEGWQSTNVVGKYQTAAHNLVKKPVYSDTIFVASGVTLSPYAADSRDLRSYMVATKSYYVEISNGANAGHRFDVNYAATTAKSIALNLSSVNNTATTLPAGLVGAQFLLREHVTLADVLPKEVFTGSTSPTAADQAQIFQNGVWVPYYLLDAAVAGFYYWSKPGGIVNWDGLVIPPGTAVLAKHFNTASTSLVCQTGEVRANVFRTSVGTGSTLHSSGYPLDDTPNARTYTVGSGFVGNTSPVGTDQIQLWLGDATPNASGYGVRYLLNAGTPSLQYWSPVGSLQNLNTTPFLLRGRGQFIKRHQATAPLNLVMPLPWEPAAALPVLP